MSHFPLICVACREGMVYRYNRDRTDGKLEMIRGSDFCWSEKGELAGFTMISPWYQLSDKKSSEINSQGPTNFYREVCRIFWRSLLWLLGQLINLYSLASWDGLFGMPSFFFCIATWTSKRNQQKHFTSTFWQLHFDGWPKAIFPVCVLNKAGAKKEKKEKTEKIPKAHLTLLQTSDSKPPCEGVQKGLWVTRPLLQVGSNPTS